MSYLDRVFDTGGLGLRPVRPSSQDNLLTTYDASLPFKPHAIGVDFPQLPIVFGELEPEREFPTPWIASTPVVISPPRSRAASIHTAPDTPPPEPPKPKPKEPPPVMEPKQEKVAKNSKPADKPEEPVKPDAPKPKPKPDPDSQKVSNSRPNVADILKKIDAMRTKVKKAEPVEGRKEVTAGALAASEVGKKAKTKATKAAPEPPKEPQVATPSLGSGPAPAPGGGAVPAEKIASQKPGTSMEAATVPALATRVDGGQALQERTAQAPARKGTEVPAAVMPSQPARRGRPTKASQAVLQPPAATPDQRMVPATGRRRAGSNGPVVYRPAVEYNRAPEPAMPPRVLPEMPPEPEPRYEATPVMRAGLRRRRAGSRDPPAVIAPEVAQREVLVARDIVQERDPVRQDRLEEQLEEGPVPSIGDYARVVGQMVTQTIPQAVGQAIVRGYNGRLRNAVGATADMLRNIYQAAVEYATRGNEEEQAEPEIQYEAPPAPVAAPVVAPRGRRGSRALAALNEIQYEAPPAPVAAPPAPVAPVAARGRRGSRALAGLDVGAVALERGARRSRGRTPTPVYTPEHFATVHTDPAMRRRSARSRARSAAQRLGMPVEEAPVQQEPAEREHARRLRLYMLSGDENDLDYAAQAYEPGEVTPEFISVLLRVWNGAVRTGDAVIQRKAEAALRILERAYDKEHGRGSFASIADRIQRS